MSSSWYCRDCETRIDAAEIDTHEADGHEVRGVVRPDRLLGNDPWNVDVHHTSDRASDPDDADEPATDEEVTD